MTPRTNTRDLESIRPGARKKHLKPGPPKTHASGHKRRSVWFQARSSWPLREAPVHTLVLERNRVKRDLPAPKAAARWRCIGPTNVGGRPTSIVCHPKHPDRICAGAAGGGVGQSSDA